jgi:hypothetical protein
MGEVLKRKPIVGETLLYVGQTNYYVTHGKTYVVAGIDDDGDAFVIDDDGDAEYVRHHSYGNYQVLSDVEEDPGYLDVYERYPIDTTGTGKIEVVVDEKSLALLYKLQRQHERAKARRKIKEKIAALEEELKKI